MRGGRSAYNAYVNDEKLLFDEKEGLADFKIAYMTRHPSVFNIQVLSREGIPFHDCTPIKHIMEDSFSIVLNNTDHFMVLKFADEDIFDNDFQRARDIPTLQMLKELGCTQAKRSILSNFANQVIDEVLKVKNSQGKINGHTLQKIIEGKVQADSLRIKMELDKIEQMLKVLYQKKASILEIKSAVEEKFSARSKRRLKALYSLIIFQMMFTQWGTYVKYSWDVMEPICNLFGIFDSILAYSFWLAKNDDYSLEKFEKSFIESRTERTLNKKFKISEQLNDIEAMINHLELWKSLHSESLPEILGALDQKFKRV